MIFLYVDGLGLLSVILSFYMLLLDVPCWIVVDVVAAAAVICLFLVCFIFVHTYECSERHLAGSVW